jgi:hypothetical protein
VKEDPSSFMVLDDLVDEDAVLVVFPDGVE